MNVKACKNCGKGYEETNSVVKCDSCGGGLVVMSQDKFLALSFKLAGLGGNDDSDDESTPPPALLKKPEPKVEPPVVKKTEQEIIDEALAESGFGPKKSESDDDSDDYDKAEPDDYDSDEDLPPEGPERNEYLAVLKKETEYQQKKQALESAPKKLPPPLPPLPKQNKTCPNCKKAFHLTTITVCDVCKTPLKVVLPPPPVPPAPPTKEMLQKIMQQKQKPPVPPLPAKFSVQPPTVKVKCQIPPKYEPQVWNDAGNVQYRTNCYSYAANDKGEGHPANDGKGGHYKPQPGEFCGHPYNAQKDSLKDCKVVKDAVACDSAAQPNGLGMELVNPTPAADKLPPAKQGYYLVAMVVAPNVDYHWYRQDENGKWSHKPGSTAATDKDAAGKEITNPALCDRDGTQKGTKNGINYSVFCGYYYVPNCGVLVGTNTKDVVDKHKNKII